MEAGVRRDDYSKTTSRRSVDANCGDETNRSGLSARKSPASNAVRGVSGPRLIGHSATCNDAPASDVSLSEGNLISVSVSDALVI
jgi:hypothetical protein